MSRTARPSVAPPIPQRDLEALTDRLAELAVPVDIDDSWQAAPPLWATPSLEGLEGVVFDVERVVSVVRAMTALRHTQGQWAGSSFRPDPWQVVWVLAPVFGWVYSSDHSRADLAGTRVIRRLWIEVPRKNGKTTLASALAIVLLAADGERGAQVYSAAVSREQARLCFDPARDMALSSPGLAEKITPKVDVLTYKPSRSYFRVLSRVADAAHGLNVHGAVIDEVHVHAKRDLIDAIETGVGARRQPLVVCITTADEGDDFTIYAEKHSEVVRLAEGHNVDPSVWGVIWASPDSEDPFAPETWARCNPGLGRSVTLAYLEGEARRAQTNSSYLPTFLRLALNRRLRQTHRWLDIADYDQPSNSAEMWLPVDGWDAFPDEWEGQRAWAGVDLSAVSDLTALGVWIPERPEDDNSPGWSLSWAWLPEDDLLERCERDGVPYDRWAADGWLHLTEGNTVDYGPILETLKTLGRVLRLEAVALDRWQGHRISQELWAARVAGVVVELPQTYQGLSGGCKVVEKAILAGRFHHGGHPLKRWNYAMVEVRRDELDNLRPVKPDRGKSAARIDCVMGDVMAAAAWERRERRPGTGAAPRSPLPSGGRSPMFGGRRLAL